NNNQYILAKVDKIFIHCYDVECQQKDQIWVETISIIDAGVTEAIFGTDFYNCLKNYVLNVDLGITEFTTTDSTVYQCDATNLLFENLVPHMNIKANYIKINTYNESRTVDTRNKKKVSIECCKIVSQIDEYSNDQRDSITSYMLARTT
ncbi:hypothetical protein HZS_574, partial [Henneguya salminicola]